MLPSVIFKYILAVEYQTQIYNDITMMPFNIFSAI